MAWDSLGNYSCRRASGIVQLDVVTDSEVLRFYRSFSCDFGKPMPHAGHHR